MDLEKILETSLSKKQNQELNTWIGHSQERFDELMSYFLHEDLRICQRTAWVFGKVCEDRPLLMMKWFPEVLGALDAPKHDAVVRNVLRAFQYVEDFPEAYEGEIFERSMEYLINPRYPIAFKAFAMTVCRKIAMKYPDLKPELVAVIQDAMVNGSAGIMSRGRKELALLSREE